MTSNADIAEKDHLWMGTSLKERKGKQLLERNQNERERRNGQY